MPRGVRYMCHRPPTEWCLSAFRFTPDTTASSPLGGPEQFTRLRLTHDTIPYASDGRYINVLVLEGG
jgi:hypothetical protein